MNKYLLQFVSNYLPVNKKKTLLFNTPVNKIIVEIMGNCLILIKYQFIYHVKTLKNVLVQVIFNVIG